MAADEALAYLVAISVPVWLLVEQAVSWLRSRRQQGEQMAAARRVHDQRDAPSAGGAVGAGAHTATQKAA